MNASAVDLKAVFSKALELAEPAERARFLAEACGENARLRVEVESLLGALDKAGSFLEAPAAPVGQTVDAPPVQEGPGSLIGPYKLLEQIGEGGFGVVFLAEQQQPVRRRVALKLLKPGMDTKQVVARFEAERQALALMDHPNIAKVLDGGETPPAYAGGSPRPYFVMDLVKGVPISDYGDQNQLPPRERLELFVNVCHAVQHAHQKGIIHRDVKPSNVLISRHDATPVVKVIDFGIAKALGQQLTDKTLFTNFAQLVGTPLYMSPEQAGMSDLDVDTRSDIYSLGVLLYELLTGTTPFVRERFKEVGYDEMRRIIREEEPPKPSTRVNTLGQAATTVATQRQSDPKRLSQLLRGELDWIVMKALEKDRNRRYETAGAFAADVRRYLNDEPVQACPPSVRYRCDKFTRRHKATLAVAAAALAAVTVMAAAFGWSLRDRAAREAQIKQAEMARLAAVETQARAPLIAARVLTEEKRFTAARQKLAEAGTRLGNDRAALPDLAAEVEAREAELDRSQKFGDLMDRAHEAETARIAGAVGGKKEHLAAARLRLEALAQYQILERADWAATLEGGFLGKDEVEQIRRTAYEALLWLADDVGSQQKEHRSGKQLSREVAARQALAYLEKAESAHRPTLALYVLRERFRKVVGADAAAQADQQLAAKTPPTMAVDYGAQGDRAARAKQWAAAVGAYEAALRLEPTHYWGLMALGDCLAQLARGPEDFAGVARVFTGCILSRPDHAYTYARRALAYSKLRHYEDAFADCAKALDLDPREATAWCVRGRLYLATGRPAEALADFSKAIDLDPGQANFWNDRGHILNNYFAQYDKAAADFSRAIELDPEYVAAWHNRAAAYAALRQWRKARSDYSRAIKLDPNYALAYHGRAAAYTNLGRWDETLADFCKAVGLRPNDAKMWSGRGAAYLMLGQPDKAVTDCTKAIKLDAKFAEAWSHRGAAYGCLGQYDQAIADSSRAIELDRKLADAWYNRGKTYAKMGQWAEALPDYSKAIELNPRGADPWHSRGVAYDRMGQPDKAITDFSKAIQLEPRRAEHWHNRAIVYHQQGRFAEALADSSKVIEFATNIPLICQAYYLRAETNRYLGRFAQAQADYGAVLKRRPTDGPPLNGLARLLATCPEPKLRDPRRAVELAGKAVAAAPRAGRYWQTLGIAHYRADEWRPAVLALDKAVMLRRGGDALDHLFLAMAHWQLGGRDEARKAYDRAVHWLQEHKEALGKEKPRVEELRRFRREAEEVLGLKKK
jgi:tetratricopeptide (TPR) repeat protein/tRNA A-37 threonylcarbamoyl transferase component Bud32